MVEIVLWLSMALIFYTYAGYSLLVMALATVKNNPVKKSDIEPTVTVLITAYNEEKSIRQKLKQTLSLDYPRGKLDIVVASDGSTDGTDNIVREFGGQGVKLARVEGRVGKTETQNQAVKQATGEIIIFSDATTTYEHTAIKKIVRSYADPTVGAVSGRYEYRNPTGASIGVGNILFWKYENYIKNSQTKIKTVTGCCGCIYSIRRDLYEPLPGDIISDLVEPLKIVEKGYRISFEPEAVAYEETTERTSEEFNMRVRVITRGMRGLMYMKSLFNPFRHGFVSFQLFSHKVLRWCVPLFMVLILIANALLLGSDFYNVLFVMQLVFYGLALIGYFGEKIKVRNKIFSVPLYFIAVNSASVIAMLRIFRGYKAVTWETVRK